MSNTVMSPEAVSATDVSTPETADPADDTSAERSGRSRSTIDWEQMEQVPHLWRHPLLALRWLVTAALGGVSLLALLTAAATFPGGNFFVLGFLLDVEGRIIRGGKLRFAIPVLPAARLGAIALCFAIWLAPVWLLANLARDALTVAPHGVTAWLAVIVFVASAAVVAAHLTLAVMCGGSLGCFLRPIRNVRRLSAEVRRGGFAGKTWRRAEVFVAVWRIPQRVWSGAIVYAGSVLWLVGPVAVFTSVQSSDAPTWPRLAMLAGGAALACVLAWIPFLQARFAAEGRWRSFFELKSIRELFGHAPLAWTFAIVVTYALSIPLYFYWVHLKMHLPPHGAVWDVMLVILLAAYPSRIVVAWAYRRALRQPRSWAPWRWMSRAILTAGLLALVWLLSHVPMIGDHGRRSLFEHHAVVVPFP
jgi:hypothetical protein